MEYARDRTSVGRRESRRVMIVAGAARGEHVYGASRTIPRSKDWPARGDSWPEMGSNELGMCLDQRYFDARNRLRKGPDGARPVPCNGRASAAGRIGGRLTSLLGEGALDALRIPCIGRGCRRSWLCARSQGIVRLVAGELRGRWNTAEPPRSGPRALCAYTARASGLQTPYVFRHTLPRRSGKRPCLPSPATAPTEERFPPAGASTVPPA